MKKVLIFSAFAGIWALNYAGFSKNFSQLCLDADAPNCLTSTAAFLTTGVASSSFPVTGVTPGSYTNTNLTVDAYGRLTAASNGSSGSSSSSLAVGTGTATTYVTNTTSPTTNLGFNGLQFNVLGAGTTSMVSANTSTFTMYGPNIPAASISAGTLGTAVYVSSGLNVTVSTLNVTNVINFSTYTTPPAADGRMYLDGAYQNFLSQINGNPISFAQRVYVTTANFTVSNSSAQTNIVPVCTVNGSTTVLKAGFLSAGKTIRVRASGVYSSTNSAPGTIKIQFMLGGTVISSTTASSLTAAQSNQLWLFTGSFTVQTSGSSGTIIGNNAAALYDPTNGFTVLPMVMPTAATINTTIDQNVALTAQFSVNHTSNSWTTTNFTITAF